MQKTAHSSILQLLPIFASALFYFAWTNPNHYAPWTAFHADWLAFSGLTLLLGYYLFLKGNLYIPIPSIAIAIISIVPLIQFKTGIIYFFGDAWMAFLYLLAFSISIFIGYQKKYNENIYIAIIYAILFASLTSFFLALNQWLLSPVGHLFITDTPPHGRPSANLSQPNQLATLLVLGIASNIQLYEKQKISRFIFIATSLALCFGTALTQSRAAWLEFLALVFLFIYLNKKFIKFHLKYLIFISIFFVFSVIFLPTLSNWLELSSRGIPQQLSSGTRPIHWMTAWDAAWLHPWTGFGWNQVSVAISQTALHHPPSHELVEHSHNLVLDILIWNGMLPGTIILISCIIYLCKKLINIKSSEDAILLIFMAIPLTHSLVEFPLEYAYFLIPFGIFIGRIELIQESKKFIAIPKIFFILIFALLIYAFQKTTSEYFRLEQETRNLRMESQKIGHPINIGENLNVIFLTQQSNFIKFSATEAFKNMPSSDLIWMKKISERYGYPPVLFRYALAAGLNTHTEESRKALQRLCKIHPPELCAEAQENWKTMGIQYPELQKIIFN